MRSENYKIVGKVLSHTAYESFDETKVPDWFYKLELHQLISMGFVFYLENVVAPQIDKDRQRRVEKYIEEERDNLKLIMGDDYENVMKHASYVMGFDLTETKIYTKEMNENAFNPSKYLDANFLLAVDGQSN